MNNRYIRRWGKTPNQVKDEKWKSYVLERQSVVEKEIGKKPETLTIPHLKLIWFNCD